jgi:phosphate transport system substrate-binding protein
VFESLYPKAAIIPVYTTDLNSYQLLMDDSIRLIIGTRLLTENELAIIKERKQRIRSHKIAIDGIAVIIHKDNNDTLLTTQQLQKVLTGEIDSWKQLNPNSPLDEITVMFDTPNSSMVRYMQDSITLNRPFGTNVKALSADSALADITQLVSHDKVIEYVATHANAIGFVGLNWISSPTDSISHGFIEGINIVSMSSSLEATPLNSYKPYPYQLALEMAHREDPREFPARGYPLTRDIFMIITDSPGGLSSGFFNFVSGDRGQRIILKSGMLPSNRPVRLVQISEE